MKQRPFEVDANEYPFQSHWFEHKGSAMHYVDEGQGVPIVMCHGNPTWSYLYRHIIKQLAPRYRCIAYDLPGFGFSDHPPGFSYKPAEHAEWVEALLFEHLKLDKFIIIGQDWGGPICLRVATRHPDAILGLILSSTFIGAPNGIGKFFSGAMGSALGQYLILRRNFFATTLVSATLATKPSPTTRHAYAAPFPTVKSRAGPAIFPVQIVASTPWLEEVKRDLVKLKDKPVEFVFGLKDLMTRPADMDAWLRLFPQAGAQRIAEANHFTQEDCPDCYVVAVERIMAGIDQSPSRPDFRVAAFT